MRPLALHPLAGTPGWVRGLSLVRGHAVPVLDLAALLIGTPSTAPNARLVLLEVNGRRFAVHVDTVIGLRDLDPEAFHAMPPLLSTPTSADAVHAHGIHDDALMLVLNDARLIPDDLWLLFTTESNPRSQAVPP